MRTNGYIHLHRSILAWNYHNNPVMFTVWAHLIMLAEYEDREQDGIIIHRGELLVSQQWLAEYIGISISQVRTCLSILEKTNEITKKKTNNLTHVKILKYDEYQGVTTSTDERHREQVHEQKHERFDGKERNINNNKKNLSDGEIQKSDSQPTTAPKNIEPTSSSRTAFIRQLVAAPFWKQKCCADYRIDPSLIDRHILAFHEYLLREQPNKVWLSFEDFCRHFHSWLRFQTPESIKRYCGLAVKRRQQQVARKMEEERQQQMWKEIEETKRKAVSYEEYLRGKRPERAFAKRT